MKDLLVEIQACEFLEYERSVDKFGRANNSEHESYAVIKEEFEEAESEVLQFKSAFDNYWDCVKTNQDTSYWRERLRVYAERAAAEWVQVAAMCYKAGIADEQKTKT